MCVSTFSFSFSFVWLPLSLFHLYALALVHSVIRFAHLRGSAGATMRLRTRFFTISLTFYLFLLTVLVDFSHLSLLLSIWTVVITQSCDRAREINLLQTLYIYTNNHPAIDSTTAMDSLSLICSLSFLLSSRSFIYGLPSIFSLIAASVRGMRKLHEFAHKI